MEEFISSNGFTMVKGELFNWVKKAVYFDQPEPTFLSISMGPMDDMYMANYNDSKLCISSIQYSRDEVYRFHCGDLKTAEIIVDAFAKGMGFEIPPLYEK
jgi:hypothetical protein